jgi:hypothetical protein
MFDDPATARFIQFRVLPDIESATLLAGLFGWGYADLLRAIFGQLPVSGSLLFQRGLLQKRKEELAIVISAPKKPGEWQTG